MHVLTLDCQSFTASTLPDGRLRLELAEPSETRAPVSPNARYVRAIAAKRLAEILGQPVSVSTIDRWMRAKKHPLPFIKPAGRPIFIEADLRQWAETKKKTAAI